MSDEQVSGKDYAKLDKQTSVDAADIQQRLEHLEAGSLDIDSVNLLPGAPALERSNGVGKQRFTRESDFYTEFLQKVSL